MAWPVEPTSDDWGPMSRPREVVEAPVPILQVRTLRRPGQDIRSGIAHTIDAMPESRLALAPFQPDADYRLGPVRCANLEHHLERRAGCATVGP